jgi:endogenous inhibitor of DNA gyrase (YacG/DUF329 family)
MKNDDVQRCATCNLPVHPDIGGSEGYISKTLHKPFCCIKCEDDFDPDAYASRQTAVAQVTDTHPQAAETAKASNTTVRFDARSAFETLRQSEEAKKLEPIPLNRFFEALKGGRHIPVSTK